MRVRIITKAKKEKKKRKWIMTDSVECCFYKWWFNEEIKLIIY